MKFFCEETCEQGCYMVYLDSLDSWHQVGVVFHGSYNVLQSRLFNLSYPDYLKYLTTLGAKLRGKEGYIFPIFYDKKVCQELAKRLNRELDKVKQFYNL